jgi:hypothetical protein
MFMMRYQKYGYNSFNHRLTFLKCHKYFMAGRQLSNLDILASEPIIFLGCWLDAGYYAAFFR